MGARGFALSYVASGIVCGIAIVLLGPGWTRPFVGASGAISGVLGSCPASRIESGTRWGSLLLVGELASAIVVLLGLLRASPPEPDRWSALMWHLIPFVVGWLWVRWGRLAGWASASREKK
jgi:membrane associated rhomboid family serine protease